MSSSGEGTRENFAARDGGRPGRAPDAARERDAASLLAELMTIVGGTSDVQVALDAAANHALTLLDARAVGLALIEGAEFVVVSRAGEQSLFPHAKAPVGAGRRALAAIGSDRPVRLHPEREEPIEALRGRAVLLAPMHFRGRTVGVLTAIERRGSQAAFRAADEPLAEAIASAAATVVAVARSATDEALRRSVAAAERERDYWARELHDGALQNLAAIRILVGQVRRAARAPDERLTAIDGLLNDEIARLRDLVHDLRPPVLHTLGVQPAAAAAVERFTQRTGVEVMFDVDLAYDQGREPRPLTREVESGIYFIANETLNDVARRGRASMLELLIHERAGRVEVRIEHDDPTIEGDRELADVGMRERVALFGGTLTVDRADGRTAIRAELPAHRR